MAAPTAATGIAVLAVISLVASEMTVRSNQAAAFYLMPYRLWELAAGGFLAVMVWKIPRTSRRTAAIIAMVGLLLVGYSAVTMTRFDVFPGFAALPTVVGTVLVVIAGTSAIGNPVSAFLSLGPLVRVGALSYSWYLIHWPLLVFARLYAEGPNLLRDSTIGVVSLGLAALSYRYVEQPFREGRWPALRMTRPTLLVGLAMLLTMIVAGLVVLTWPEHLSRVGVTEAQQVALDDDPFGRCPIKPAGSPDPSDCAFGGTSDKTLVVVGDSHAATLMPAAKAFADKHGWSLDVMWHPGCPFFVDYQPPPGAPPIAAGCAEENRIRMDYILENADSIDGVLVTSRSDRLMYNPDGSEIPGARQRWEEAVRSTTEPVAAAGIPVLQMLDVPTFEHAVPQCLVRIGEGCDISLSEAESARAPASDAEIAALDGIAGAQTWDPLPTLCRDGTCRVEVHGDILYTDTNHLSEAGSLYLAGDLTPAIEDALGLPSSPVTDQ